MKQYFIIEKEKRDRILNELSMIDVINIKYNGRMVTVSWGIKKCDGPPIEDFVISIMSHYYPYVFYHEAYDDWFTSRRTMKIAILDYSTKGFMNSPYDRWWSETAGLLRTEFGKPTLFETAPVSIHKVYGIEDITLFHRDGCGYSINDTLNKVKDYIRKKQVEWDVRDSVVYFRNAEDVMQWEMSR